MSGDIGSALASVLADHDLSRYQLAVMSAGERVADLDTSVRHLHSAAREPATFAMWCATKPIVMNGLARRMLMHGVDPHEPIGQISLGEGHELFVHLSMSDVLRHDGVPTHPELVSSRLLMPLERADAVAAALRAPTSGVEYASFVGAYVLARWVEQVDDTEPAELLNGYVSWCGGAEVYFGADAVADARGGNRGLYCFRSPSGGVVPLTSDLAPIMALDDPAVYGGYASARGLAATTRGVVRASSDVLEAVPRAASPYWMGFATNSTGEWFGGVASPRSVGHVGWNNLVWVFHEPALDLTIGCVSQEMHDPAALRRLRVGLIDAAVRLV